MVTVISRRVSAPFHDLRHTFASDLLGADAPMLEVSRWLRPASIQTTIDTYGPLADPDEHETVDQPRAQRAKSDRGGVA